ncbi:unnamed protein product, partial [Linum tenue]
MTATPGTQPSKAMAKGRLKITGPTIDVVKWTNKAPASSCCGAGESVSPFALSAAAEMFMEF